MGNRVQEANAQKQTNLKILMHVSQNILIEDIQFAHRFPTSTYTQKGRQPYLF